jgi:hypothetical protein
MTCEQHLEALGDYVDGTLPPGDRLRLEEHLATCEACRRTAGDLAQIRKAAAELPAVKPPDRIWARIAHDLAAAEPPASRAASPSRVATWSATVAAGVRRLAAPVPLLGAAVVLLAVLAGYLVISRGPAPSTPGTSASATTPGKGGSASARATNADLVQTVDAELKQAELHYEKAIAGLEQITKAGQGNLDPQVTETLQRNLVVIDQAIRESKQALQSQPTSELAQESLFEAFRRKVALLQDTVSLINEMRKGNQDGAARIIGNLNK